MPDQERQYTKTAAYRAFTEAMLVTSLYEQPPLLYDEVASQIEEVRPGGVTAPTLRNYAKDLEDHGYAILGVTWRGSARDRVSIQLTELGLAHLSREHIRHIIEAKGATDEEIRDLLFTKTAGRVALGKLAEKLGYMELT